jgi:hypothetical protein
MSDLVGTCPKGFWEEWIAEGDAAGSQESGMQWSWYTGDRKAASLRRGDRFYVVAHGKLRGWAPVTDLLVNEELAGGTKWQIIRQGNAVACTIPEPIQGFRGLRVRWWKRENEQPFENWRKP